MPEPRGRPVQITMFVDASVGVVGQGEGLGTEASKISSDRAEGSAWGMISC